MFHIMNYLMDRRIKDVSKSERNGRYFTDMTEESFKELLQKLGNLEIEETWITSDVRPGRGEEKWLNLFLRKK